MQGIDWSLLVTSLVSRAAEVLFGAIGGFIAAGAAFKYAAKRDVLKLTAELRQEHARVRTARRDQVIDELWKKATVALEKASIATAMLKQYPDFKRLSDQAASEILLASRLSDRQREELLDSPDRTKYYIDATFWLDLNDARKALYDLNSFFLNETIHIPADMASTLNALVKALNDAFISYEIWHESPEPQLMRRARSEIKQAQESATSLEGQLRVALEK